MEHLKKLKDIRNSIYKQIRESLSPHDGVVYYANRRIIPETLRKGALKLFILDILE